MRRRNPLRIAYLRLLARNRMLAEELTSTMESVVDQECTILKLEEQLQNLREEVEKASGQEDDGTDVPVAAGETCRCAGCVRSRTERTLRELTPLHGLQMRGLSFGVPWGMG